MSPFAIGGIAFLFIFGAALLGMFLRSRLPGDHLSAESRDAIKLATAIIGTLSALALGLLIASAKRSFDDAGAETRTWAARVLLLDRVMAHYGAETAEMRASLRELVETRLSEVNDTSGSKKPPGGGFDVEPVQDGLRSLSPQTEAQRWLQSRALQLSGQIAEARWLRTDTEAGGFPGMFLVILVFWLALLFASFGLLAPGNATVVATLFVCALSVTAALVLIIDMDHPYLGLIRVSDAPLRLALERVDRP
ncbi:bestrophin-like domain [Bosea sp. (in: a-proteobacteria)]|uniref:bestrophin-like domain n=1 Tax=Bosea sp. (in: a-proteobacteria) TaxID=1871050 RepID=UPI002FC72426